MTTEQDLIGQPNAVTAIWGISGSGKTSLFATYVEYVWEVFHRITRLYSSDLGGWGNKLLSLMKRGMCQTWYLRNHVLPFETMELASLGWWPESFTDPMTGMAAADVPLIAPRVVRYTLICPQGHVVGVYPNEPTLTVVQKACPTCGTVTAASNCLRVDKTIVRSKGFKHIGAYGYDSATQLDDWALADLKVKSARGELPKSEKTGGSTLGSMDALREVGSRFVFGGGSEAQFGFVQDRTFGWIANIRTIPDQVAPPIMTFSVEQSKGDARRGQPPSYGPKIAGTAMTLAIGGSLGNSLHATKEPVNVTGEGVPISRHRLWLTTHFDPTDSNRTPYIAKHRGEPLGMPDFLEDDLGEDGRPIPFSKFSLKVLFKLLDTQQEAITKRDAEAYPDAPADKPFTDDGEEVLAHVEGIAPSAIATGPVPLTGPVARQGRSRARRPGTVTAAVAPVAAPSPSAVAPAPIAEAPAGADRVAPSGGDSGQAAVGGAYSLTADIGGGKPQEVAAPVSPALPPETPAGPQVIPLAGRIARRARPPVPR